MKVMQYTPERKEAVLKKMMPPHARPISRLAIEEGISEATLYKWRLEARQKGILLPNASSEPNGWSARDKFSAVMETAAMNESEMAEYCRKKGIYPEQVIHWRKACENANDWDRQVANKLKAGQKEDQKRIKQLEKELKRKEKALAEAAALLVLQKKVQAIWGDPEGE
jgi:transposase-like protein